MYACLCFHLNTLCGMMLAHAVPHVDERRTHAQMDTTCDVASMLCMHAIV